jgi:hypothetical protein
MTIKIGPKGYVDLVASDVGAAKKIRIVAFKGLAAAGEIPGQHFPVNASKSRLAATIDVTTGLNATAYFRDTGSLVGDLHLTQVDTGATPNHSGNTMWAIITDTGVN